MIQTAAHTEVQTIEDLRAALKPGGYVACYVDSLGNRRVHLHKTYVQTLVGTLCRQKPKMVVSFTIEHPEATGHWQNPRRTVVLG